MEEEEYTILTGERTEAAKRLAAFSEDLTLTPWQKEEAKAQESIAFCTQILENSRTELFLSMRFLDLALHVLSFYPLEGTGPCGTDGDRLYYHPETLLKVFLRSRVPVNRAYMHMLLHCLFGHLDGQGKRAKEYWDLSCDIAAESIIDTLYYPALHLPARRIRTDLISRLKKSCPVLNAESIYKALGEMELSEEEYERLRREYLVDDHRFWQGKDPDRPSPRASRSKDWKDLREKMQTQIETFGREAAEGAGDLVTQVKTANRERYDYKKFLRRFCVLKETMHVDTDSFDYIYYTYGMKLYGNMPLIEHMETKEERRVEDFVIVIDTSASCEGELVKKFLEQTYAVLSESESFFRRIHVHILQCDEKVQSDAVIHNARELEQYMERGEIRGQGGTDFRPAFEYVDRLLEEHDFDCLRGLIYFTDGYGTYPSKMPPYETAFVFLKEACDEIDVPAWAIRLVLAPEDLEEKDSLLDGR